MSRLTTAKQSKGATSGSQTARVMSARERIVEEERHRADRCHTHHTCLGCLLSLRLYSAGKRLTLNSSVQIVNIRCRMLTHCHVSLCLVLLSYAAAACSLAAAVLKGCCCALQCVERVLLCAVCCCCDAARCSVVKGCCCAQCAAVMLRAAVW